MATSPSLRWPSMTSATYFLTNLLIKFYFVADQNQDSIWKLYTENNRSWGFYSKFGFHRNIPLNIQGFSILTYLHKQSLKSIKVYNFKIHTNKIIFQHEIRGILSEQQVSFSGLKIWKNVVSPPQHCFLLPVSSTWSPVKV